MSAPPYMPLFVGDYLADTTHLTCTEHGAYILLLMAMWRAGGTLPDDPAKLARFARCTGGQWARISDTILAFFDREDGVIIHGRLAREMTKHTVAVEQRRQAASNGGRAKALKTLKTKVPDASSPLCQPEPEPEKNTPTEPNGSAAPKGADASRGTRLSEDWSPPDDGDAARFGLTAADYFDQADRFRDYWRAVPGAKGRKADWHATWRNWLRRASENTPRKPHERPRTDHRHDAFLDKLLDVDAAMGAAFEPSGPEH